MSSVYTPEIEARKQKNEKSAQLKKNRENEAKKAAAKLRAEEEAARLAAESKRREEERVERERAQKELQAKQTLASNFDKQLKEQLSSGTGKVSSKVKKLQALTENVGAVDKAAILQAQAEVLQQQKLDAERKLRDLSKKADYFVRAQRLEERPLIVAHQAKIAVTFHTSLISFFRGCVTLHTGGLYCTRTQANTPTNPHAHNHTDEPTGYRTRSFRRRLPQVLQVGPNRSRESHSGKEAYGENAGVHFLFPQYDHGRPYRKVHRRENGSVVCVLFI